MNYLTSTPFVLGDYESPCNICGKMFICPGFRITAYNPFQDMCSDCTAEVIGKVKEAKDALKLSKEGLKALGAIGLAIATIPTQAFVWRELLVQTIEAFEGEGTNPGFCVRIRHFIGESNV